MSNTIVTLLVVVIAFAAAIFGPVVIKRLKAKTDNETLLRCLDELDYVTHKAVMTTMQIYVQKMKEDGEFDDAAQKAAFTMTKAAILDMLSNEAIRVLRSTIGDIDTYLKNAIEAEVYDSKMADVILEYTEETEEEE